MSHILIITGGHLDIAFLSSYIKTLSYDKVFAVDKGLEYAKELGIVPDKIIGDLDSVNNRIIAEYEQLADTGWDSDDVSHEENCDKKIEIIKYPAKKAATDTELALECAKNSGADAVTIFGATGLRLDHMLANIQLLHSYLKRGMECVIVDEINRVRVIDSQINDGDYLIDRESQYGKYISLIPITDVLEDLIMEGVMYPVVNLNAVKGNTLLISNQITEKTAHIHIGTGAALFVESRD